MELKKTVVFTRHGIRYPLIYTEEFESRFGKKNLVNWEFEDERMGNLTKKGELVEFIFGQELKNILNTDNIKDPYYYCNCTKRTYLTAKILATSMFPYAKIDINKKYKELERLDVTFNTILKDKYVIDKEKSELLDKKMIKVYTKMEEILGLEKGAISDKKTELYIDDTGYLHASGAIRMATDICDLFILKYYENFPLNEIFESDNFLEDLKLMATAKDEFLDLIFSDKKYTLASIDNVFNLLNELIKKDNDLILVAGHDSNIATILSMLDVDLKIENDAIEKYPIGSKLIFKIYEDNSYELYYSYLHYDTIRNLDGRKPTVRLLKKGTL